MLDPYPAHYRPAFASSGIPYPLVHRPPSRASFHCPVETVGLTTLHTSTIPGGVRLRLCAGGTTSARSEIRTLLPGHVPFGSSLSASLACRLLRRLHSGSLTLAIPSNPSSRPPRGWQSQRRLAVRLPALQAEATLFRELRTPGSPPAHVPVGYRWQNTESSLINTRATSCRTPLVIMMKAAEDRVRYDLAANLRDRPRCAERHSLP